MEFDYYDYECHERGYETEMTNTWTQANTVAGTSSGMEDGEESWPGVGSDMGDMDNTAWWTANNEEVETEASLLLSRHQGTQETRIMTEHAQALEESSILSIRNKPPIMCLEELEIWDESNDESV